MNNRTEPLTGTLSHIKNEIESYAKKEGLDFPEVIFEICDYETINILAAQEGFPTRYPHWRFGMNYDQLYKGHSYGMQKIYELVINTEPCYAYLHKSNNFVDQKIVMAHVYGHADFFKNNCWFANTDKNMMDVMANHGAKIRRYISQYGQEKVETFIDKVLSLENLTDINVLFETQEIQRRRRLLNEMAKEEDKKEDPGMHSEVLQSFIRSKKKIETKNKDIIKDLKISEDKKKESPSPRDIMRFLLENAPLEEWEADIIGILRDEAYYFLPQKITKIMNEGWASYWHSSIMTEKALKASEIVDFCDRHASVMVMEQGQINPYKLGIELFRDIEYRWNTGKFGREYEECQNMFQKDHWNKELGLGRNKIFEIRRSHNDITFIDEYLTKEFCERQQLFTYRYNSRTGRYEIDSKDFETIKSKLLMQLTNFGSPAIQIGDSNFNNRKELLLEHIHQGIDLDLNLAKDTMKNIHAIWKRPINLKTLYDDNEIIFTFDGKEMKQNGAAFN